MPGWQGRFGVVIPFRQLREASAQNDEQGQLDNAGGQRINLHRSLD